MSTVETATAGATGRGTATAGDGGKPPGPCPAAAGGQPMSPSVAEIEIALAQARELKAWWGRVEAGKAPVERFLLSPPYPGMAATWGFFGEAPVAGQAVPVMGDVGDYFFDQPRVPRLATERAAEWMEGQAEEFALRYWLRVQAYALPLPYPELGHLPAPTYLQWLRLCYPAELPAMSGMGNLQRYYKLRAGGRTGEFPPSERRAIVDLRDLGSVYEWITLDTRLFDFNLDLSLVAGDYSLALAVPLGITVHNVLSEDLIVNQRRPSPGTRGAFGIGFGMMRDAASGVIDYGPGKVQPGMGLQYLQVLDSGEVRLRVVTIMARPDELLNLSLDPVAWGREAADLLTRGAASRFTKPLAQAWGQLAGRGLGFDPLLGALRLLNLATGGKAADELCLSKEELEKQIVAKDAVTLRGALLGTRQIWLRVPNWLDPVDIPRWVLAPGAAEPPGPSANPAERGPA
ncbi:MAG TPA: hypothetical protein VHQ90_24350 [Thermoanaerobaculia bacterium]|nr:hypothetical protein [Thermoanaerobaculia bacterium]